MKPFLAAIFSILVVTGIQAGTLRTEITLGWSYPTNSFTVTNGTETVLFTNNVDVFVLYSSPNPTINTTNWPVYQVIPGTNRTVTIPLTSQMRFFVMTASNYWGESSFSNVEWTQPHPFGVSGLRLQ